MQVVSAGATMLAKSLAWGDLNIKRGQMRLSTLLLCGLIACGDKEDTGTEEIEPTPEDADGDGAVAELDCDDNNPDARPGATVDLSPYGLPPEASYTAPAPFTTMATLPVADPAPPARAPARPLPHPPPAVSRRRRPPPSARGCRVRAPPHRSVAMHALADC